MDTTQHTVTELIELWQAGDLTFETAEVRKPGHEVIEVVYQGSDGSLIVAYDLTPDRAYRTDRQPTKQINIYEANTREQD